jgi:hypothetical protein
MAKCMHESNTFPGMRVNLGKICVAVSILKALFPPKFRIAATDMQLKLVMTILWYILILNMLHYVDNYAIRYTA